MTIQLSPDTQSAMKRLEAQPPTSDQYREADQRRKALAVPDSREPASAVGGVSEDLARLAATPAAQAVLDAMRRSYDHEPTRRAIAAAVLRALADHQTPAWDGGPLCHWTPTPHTRQELRNIAAELEGSTSTGSTH